MQPAKLAVPLLIAVCVPTAAFAGYGMDIVPGSSFQYGTWQFQGADPAPQTSMHSLGMHIAYGSDRVPGTSRELTAQHPDHVLISETIQHLTGAVEVAPSGARGNAPAVKKSSRPPQRDSKCPPGR